MPIREQEIDALVNRGARAHRGFALSRGDSFALRYNRCLDGAVWRETDGSAPCTEVSVGVAMIDLQIHPHWTPPWT